MSELPLSLEDAIAQAKQATKAALDDGQTRVQVELVFPEIALQAQSIAQAFIPIFEQYGSGLKIFFPDTGASALAHRDWGEVPFKITDVGTSRSPAETRIDDDDQLFLLVGPSAVEVAQVEKICNLAGDRPCVILNPQLEDVSIVGIGYAARQLRDRFLKTLESCYYLRPFPGGALWRCYPSVWQVWLEIDHEYQLVTEEPSKPTAEAIEQIILKASLVNTTSPEDSQSIPSAQKKQSLFSGIQKFLNALSR
ncbi:DUF1995 family protein [Moorena sp. SIO3I8]|uniref:DUF1995 family protein n=1 Tax=Moorena sp. SIO3I8 TaxID=2607833 RepID=UPI0013BF1619|nr:DUF1995 family protein [Moorena sp. SIO3I8]NEO07550.1 DUF1995 family protein [Moorena sp. SIO3I8]